MSITRIVMRAGKAPHTVLSAEASLAFGKVGTFATNTGNLLFATAVYRHLKTPGATILTDGMTLQRAGVTDADCARLNDDADALVLPMANAFRDDFAGPLDRLASVVERLTIPVIVTGVGGQAPLGERLDSVSDAVNAATRRFVAAVLERSESIGVRGEATAEYLRRLGFPDDRIDIIGCPSMFDLDHARHVAKPASLDPDAPMAITLTASTPGDPERFAHNFATHPGLVYIPQGHRDLRLMMWGEPVPAGDHYPPGMPATIDDPAYRSGRMRMFVDLATWSAFMAGQDFVFGSRFHGAVAALHAGTPTLLLVHDSRTLELADYHKIPCLRVGPDTPLDALDLFEAADFTGYNAVAADRQATYARFLERNGLQHTLEPANRDREYDALLAATVFPPPVTPITAADPDQLIGRLNWLWQGKDADARRVARVYSAEWPANSAEAVQAPFERQLAVLRNQLDRQAKQLVEHERTLTELASARPGLLGRLKHGG